MNAAKIFRKTLGIAVLGAAAAAVMTGCAGDEPKETTGYGALEDYTLLMDHFYRVVGTPEEMPYNEMCLYSIAGDDEHLLMETYESGGTDKEIKTEYVVPVSALEESLAAAKKYDMAGWDERDDCEGITGVFIVVKYREEDGSYVRVTSEHMPADNGKTAFNEVGNALSKYATDEYKK